MVSIDLLQQVRHIIQTTDGPFEIRDVAMHLEETTHKRYDDSVVREAIWYLIDRGEVDLTQDRKFVSTTVLA